MMPPATQTRSPRRWALVTGVVLIATLVLAEVLLERYLRASQFRDRQLQVTRTLGTLTAEIGAIINSNLSLLSGLAAHIGIQPDITQSEFEHYARTIFRQEPLLTNLAAAPDMVIRYIYPLASNRPALGLNYRNEPEQWQPIKNLRQRGAMIVAGPVELVQGGQAIIGRAAVVTSDDRFWGIVSAPMRIQPVLRRAGLLDPGLGIEVAIRGKDGRGASGEVFYGDPALFDDKRSVLSQLNMTSNNRWQLAARPSGGWHTNSGQLWLLRTGFALTSALVILLVLYRYRQIRKEASYQMALEKNETLLQEVGKLALVGGWQITPQGDQLIVTHWSEQTSKVLGLEPAQGTPSLETLTQLFNANQGDLLRSWVIGATLGTPFDMELGLKNDRGKPKRWVRIIGKPVQNSQTPHTVLGSVQDITERKRFTDKIQQQAIYDQLTGLPNRLLFHNRLSKAIARAQREQTQLAVLFIDLDNFKPVNDNLGHNAGDQLLKQVGARIKHCIRASDTIARYSGDEFIAILHDIRSARSPVAIAEQIIDSVAQPFHIRGHDIFCSASVGISLFPDDGDNAEVLVSNADQAMYEVKRAGRNGWQFFTKNMQQLSEKRHSLTHNLINALHNNELSVHYQPIMDLTENRIKKCEALVRWFHIGEQVPTDEFISLAEETGRINEIDRFVLASATEFLIEQSQTLGYTPGLSINVSPRVFSTKDNSLERWLALVQYATRSLEVTVEITERMLIDESDRIMWVLTQLKTMGVQIAIDDFGTGYSSLSYLTKFPLDIIKIDQAFVKKLGEDPVPEALTETMIHLSHKLSLEVVAEGIETAGQLAMLKHWHCDYGQGYYFDKPLTGDAFIRTLRAQLDNASLV